MTVPPTINQPAAKPYSGRRVQQVRQVVVDCIRRNSLKAGDRVPTEMELRREYGWSRDTITRALNDLVKAGVLTRVQGSGTFVADCSPAIGARERILVSSRGYKEGDVYCGALFGGIREVTAEQQVEIRHVISNAMPTPDIVHSQEVSGVLAISWDMDDWPALYALHAQGIPVVGLAYRSRVASLPTVCMDNYGGVRQAMKALLDRGHRRIGFASINMQTQDVHERYLAFNAAMAEAGISVDPTHVQLSRMHMETRMYDVWWRSLSPAPTALLIDSVIAPSILTVLLKNGVAIPADLSVAVMGEVDAVAHFDPPLAVVAQSVFELGRRGFEKLLKMLRKEDDGSPEVLPMIFATGESISAPRNSHG